jgi:hypothetical protein
MVANQIRADRALFQFSANFSFGAEFGSEVRKILLVKFLS